jgi:Fe-S cluster biogenesis protein NfuA
VLQEALQPGRALLDACARDEVVGGLLLLHGLHPLDVETRVRQALEQVRPYLRSHGGNVELLGVDGGVVRLRLEGSCHSCPSSSATMQQTVEEAIYGKAPEVTAVEVEGMAEAAPAPETERGRVALPIL